MFNNVKGKLDQCQFEYKQDSSTEDAVASLVHIITKHLDKCNSYVKALFHDTSSAFDTIQVKTIVSKQLDVNPYLIKWLPLFSHQ